MFEVANLVSDGTGDDGSPELLVGEWAVKNFDLGCYPEGVITRERPVEDWLENVFVDQEGAPEVERSWLSRLLREVEADCTLTDADVKVICLEGLVGSEVIGSMVEGELPVVSCSDLPDFDELSKT